MALFHLSFSDSDIVIGAFAHLDVRRCLLALLLLGAASACGQPSGLVADTQHRVNELRQSLTSGELPARSGYARQQLDEILAARQFAETTRGLSPWERWKHQLALWLEKHLAALIGSMARHPSTSQAIFWTMAIGALAVIAFQLFRLFRTSDLLDSRLSHPDLPVSKSTPEWIAAAQSAGERGEFSKAIQCVYWAAIVHLQSIGSLPKSGSHTPREFLRDLRAPSPIECLRSLTSSLERFWYARRPATGEDFAACLRAVQGLGCKLD